MNDESTENYVVIEAPHSEKMRLTDHQKEKLAERWLDDCYLCHAQNSLNNSRKTFVCFSDSLLCFVDESQSIDLAARIPPGYTDCSSVDRFVCSVYM